MSNSSIPEVGGRSAKFALILLVIVYVFNFIDRQILTILAEDLKADLNISDSDIGFLYGTAFFPYFFMQFLTCSISEPFIISFCVAQLKL